MIIIYLYIYIVSSNQPCLLWVHVWNGGENTKQKTMKNCEKKKPKQNRNDNLIDETDRLRMQPIYTGIRIHLKTSIVCSFFCEKGINIEYFFYCSRWLLALHFCLWKSKICMVHYACMCVCVCMRETGRLIYLFFLCDFECVCLFFFFLLSTTEWL